jgi:hypothetical protein
MYSISFSFIAFQEVLVLEMPVLAVIRPPYIILTQPGAGFNQLFRTASILDFRLRFVVICSIL